jgi:hypothetical protein
VFRLERGQRGASLAEVVAETVGELHDPTRATALILIWANERAFWSGGKCVAPKINRKLDRVFFRHLTSTQLSFSQYSGALFARVDQMEVGHEASVR